MVSHVDNVDNAEIEKIENSDVQVSHNEENGIEKIANDDVQADDFTIAILRKLLTDVLEERVGEHLRRLCLQQSELLVKIDNTLVPSPAQHGGRSRAASKLSSQAVALTKQCYDSEVNASSVPSRATDASSFCPQSTPQRERSSSFMFESPSFVKDTLTDTSILAQAGSRRQTLNHHLHRVDSCSSIRTSDRTTRTNTSHRPVMPDLDRQLIDGILGSSAFSDYAHRSVACSDYVPSRVHSIRSSRSRSQSQTSSPGSLSPDIRKAPYRNSEPTNFMAFVRRDPSRSIGTASEFSSPFSCQTSVQSSSLYPSSVGHSPSLNAKKNMEHLRKERERQLINTLEHDELSMSSLFTTLLSLPCWALCVTGIRPFRNGMKSAWYLHVVRAMSICMVLCSIVLVVLDVNSSLSRPVHLNTACYSICAMVGLLALHANEVQTFLGPAAAPLAGIAHRFDFFEAWIRTSAWYFFQLVLLWLLAGLSRSFVLVDYMDTLCSNQESDVCWSGYVSIILYWLLAGSFTALTYCQMHIVAGLELMINVYTSRFVETANVSEGIVEWNLVQAVLRRAAYTVEPCMLAQQTCGLATLVLTGVEVVNLSGPFAKGDVSALSWALSILLPVVMTLYAAFKSAAVTDKCMRVPSMVNSMIPTFACDEKQSALRTIVSFIRHADAGFYVKGVRLTSFMVLKILYILGLAVLSMTLHVLRSEAP